MKKSILVFGVLFVVFASCGTKKKGDNLSAPVSVIFDTDMGPDYDDAGALAMLHAMADSNECRILATVASNKHPRIAAVLNVFNTYFGRPEIPVGVPVGNAADMGAPQKWDSLITATYPHKLKSNDQAEDALKLYRRILAAEPDSSVTIVTVGFLTNMANLLASNGDELSPLDGASLIRKKVKRLVCMAGNFDDPAETFKEFNVVKDAASAKAAFDGWPTPIIFSGFEVGVKIFTGLPLIHNDRISNSPVKDVFARSIPLDPNDKNGRMSWDETAVLAAVRGHEKYFEAETGKIICRTDGTNALAETCRQTFLIVFLSVFKRRPSRQLLKLLVKIREVIEPALRRYLIHGSASINQQFVRQTNAQLIGKLNHRFIGAAFKISAKCGRRHIGYIGHILQSNFARKIFCQIVQHVIQPFLVGGLRLLVIAYA